MPAVFDLPHTVRDDEIDDQGHVNNVHYVGWMQSAAVEHSSVQGWPPQRYIDQGGGWVARSHFIEYLLPAFAGEQIVVRTWVSDFKKITSLRKYKIIRLHDDKLLAVAETNWAFIGLKHRVPRRIPPELAEAFEIVPAENEP